MRIAIVGKYVDLTESYKSLAEALTHGGIANDCRVIPQISRSEKIEQDGIDGHLEDVDGILVPGGFGERGTEGKIRRSNMPGPGRSRSSASVSACRWRWWSLPAMSAALRTPIPANSSRTARTR